MNKQLQVRRKHLKKAEAEALGWYGRAVLAKMNLMPSPANDKPKGTVWAGFKAYPVYDPAECIPLVRSRLTKKPRQKINLEEQFRRYDEWLWSKWKDEDRPACIVTAKKWFEDAVFLDTETTGLDEDSEIVEIAAIDRNGVLMNELVCPVLSMRDEAFAIHGISSEMLVSARTWDAVQPDLVRAIGGRPVVAYNAAFDSRMVAQSAKKRNIKVPTLTWMCAMELFGVWVGSEQWISLREAARICEIEVLRSHRAIDDCFTTRQILGQIANSL